MPTSLSRIVAAREVVHRLELANGAFEPLVLTGNWAASPVAALSQPWISMMSPMAERQRLRQHLEHRQQLRIRESRRLTFPHCSVRFSNTGDMRFYSAIQAS